MNSVTTYDRETIPGVEITRGADYKGREYTGPYIVRVSHMADGPGYYIWQYSDDSKTLYRMAARPNVQPRKLKNWNCQVRRGWRTMAEAEAILQQILRPEKQPA